MESLALTYERQLEELENENKCLEYENQTLKQKLRFENIEKTDEEEVGDSL